VQARRATHGAGVVSQSVLFLMHSDSVCRAGLTLPTAPANGQMVCYPGMSLPGARGRILIRVFPWGLLYRAAKFLLAVDHRVATQSLPAARRRTGG